MASNGPCRRSRCNCTGRSSPASSHFGRVTPRRARKTRWPCSISRWRCLSAGWRLTRTQPHHRKMEGNAMASVAELMEALPEPVGEFRDQPPGPLPELLEDWALRPVPVGAFRRLRVLGTLNAEIGAAYLFHWLRGWFQSAAEQERQLAETHWRTAL